MGDDKRFIDNRDGTVTDIRTGLIWMRNANCFGKTMLWGDARQACRALSSSINWRLPERIELESLLDFTKHNPALPKDHPFLDIQQGWYWSDTDYITLKSHVWTVCIHTGRVVGGYKAGVNRHVWPVRGRKLWTE